MTSSRLGPLERAAFLAHARSPTFARRLAEMQRILDQHLEPARAYVSFSGGKDSSVVAHAVAARAPQVPVLLSDVGTAIQWSEVDKGAWRDFAERSGWDYHVFPWGGDHGLDVFRGVNDYASARGRTQRVMGLRAGESRMRAANVARRGVAYAYAAGGSALLPIAYWSLEDVWAYILSRGLPYLSAYEQFGPATRSGFAPHATHPDGLRYGRVARLRDVDPGLYLYVLREVPDAQYFG